MRCRGLSRPACDDVDVFDVAPVRGDVAYTCFNISGQDAKSLAESLDSPENVVP